MKILHVIPELDERIGGPPRSLATLARAQAAQGDDVAVLGCRRSSGPPTLPVGQSGGLTVHEPPGESLLLWYDRRVRAAIFEAARDRDILHVHGTWRYHSLASAAAARAHRIPFVLRPYGNLGVAARGHRRWLKMPYFALFERRAAGGAAGIHCASRKEQNELEGLGLTARSFVVPNPVDTTLCDLEPDPDALERLCPGLRPEHRVVLYLGRISFIKNLHVLLEAFIRLRGDFPAWRLVLAGPHEFPRVAASLERRIEEAGLRNEVWMPGMVRGAAKVAFLRRADLFAQPSRQENFGVSVAEALLFGKPCVVSRDVALSVDIEEASAGSSAPSRVEPFERELRRALADEKLRGCWSQAARRLAQRFAPAVVAQELAREYARCLERSA